MADLPGDDSTGLPDDYLNELNQIGTNSTSGNPQYPVYYPGGSTPQSYQSDSTCGPDLCSCLEPALESIATSQYRIANALEDQYRKNCDDIAKCGDQILYEIKKRVEKGAKTCDECKTMAQQGLAGTLEYAVACANACIGEAKTVCSLGDPSSEGKRCDGCGHEPCCCDKGVCKPCPEDQQPKKRYIGWCDPISKVVLVTKEGEDSPGPTYFPVAPTDTEQAAITEAQIYCNRQQQDTAIPLTDPFPSPLPASRYCDIGSYITGRAVNDLGSGVGLANRLAGAQRALNAAGSIGLAGINLNNIGEVLGGIFSASFGAPMAITADFADLLGKLMGCDNEQYKGMIKALSSFDVLQQRMGSNFSEFLEPYRYAMRAQCPFRMLSPDQAMSSYLAASSNIEDLAGYWAIAGYCPDEFKRIVQASRSKPIPRELALMRLRGMIGQSGYNVGMRQLGYLETEVQENLFKLYQQIPPVSEIIRYMVRDAADEGLVKQFGLDDLFEQKYIGQLKQWGEQQGIPEQFARYSWRAHWIIPAPGQLFEMYHRLRKNDGYNAPKVTREEIKDALAQQDIAPFWQDKFLAISFRPLNRVDIRRSFNIGAIQQTELQDLYSQLGYDDATCIKLEKFSVRLRDLSAASHKAVKLYNNFMLTKVQALQRMIADGLPQNVAQQALTDSEMAFKSSSVAAAFANGEIDLTTFLGELSTHGVDPASITAIVKVLGYKRTASPALADYTAGLLTNNAASMEMIQEGVPTLATGVLIQRADRAVARQQTMDCLSGLRRRYLAGEFNQQQIMVEVSKAGIVNPQATNIVNAWTCHKSALGKQIPAAKLCKWLAIGIIQAPEFIQRLINIGYTNTTANLMLSECLTGISQSRLAQAKREAKDAELAQRRATAQAAKTQAAIDRQRKSAELARSKQAKIREARQKQLIQSAEKIMKAGEMPLTEAMDIATQTLAELKAQYHLSEDEALQTLLLASDNIQPGNLQGFFAYVDQLASAAANSEFTPSLEEVGA